MFSNKKSGKSLILLTIVIVVMSVALIFVMKMFNTGKTDKAQEEAFKLSVYEYNIEIKEYKTEQLYTQEEFNEENLNVYGAKLKEVIPNMAETDMSKFKIEHGKLIYIGNDTNEERWTKEVRI
jgi:predicted negative regulator of RcsB-dependent stress response